MKKVRVNWRNGEHGFTVEYKNNLMTCLETGISVDKTEDEFNTFINTLSEFADIEKPGTMKKADISKLERAIKWIDRAYDLIGEVRDNLNDGKDDATVEHLEDVQREISGQQYYLRGMIDANKK